MIVTTLSGDAPRLPHSVPAAGLWAFVGRRDTYALQLPGGRYERQDAPLTADILDAHLTGALTVASYTVREDGNCTLVVLDFDGIPPGLEARGDVRRRVERALGDLGLDRKTFVQEFSGLKGYHTWLFFEAAIPQGDAFRFARLLKRLTGASEAFPKASKPTGKGLGNAVKLPRGVHRRSRRRSFIVGPDLKPDNRPLADIVSSVPRLIPSIVQTVIARDGVDNADAHSAYDAEAPSVATADTEPNPQNVPPSGLPRRACLDRVERTGVHHGERVNWTWVLAMDHRDHGKSRDEVRRDLLRWNRDRNRPPLDHREIVEQVDRAYHGRDRSAQPYVVPGCSHPILKPKCVGVANCPWWLAQHPEVAADKLTLEHFISMGWPARFKRAAGTTTLAYSAIIRLEGIRGFAPGKPVYAALREWAWAAGLRTRKTVKRALERLRDHGLIAFASGRRGIGSATVARRLLPIAVPK